MRRIQDLPDAGALEYLQLVGVDTLVLHRDEFAPEALAALTAGLEAAPAVRLRGEVGASLIYSLDALAALDLPPGTIFVSNDERMPGLPTLGLIRRWQAEGRALSGPGRLRFYAPLGELAPGQVAAFGLLAADADPAAHGYAPAGRLWAGQGLALYRRDPRLLASLDLGAPVPGQFHPRYPASLELATRPGGLRAGDAELAWSAPADAVLIELDLASLGGALLVDGQPLELPPGRSTVRLASAPGQALRIAGDPDRLAMLRLRALDAQDGPTVAPAPGLVAAAEAAFDGSVMTVRARATGGDALLLDVRGARTSDDRPIYLLSGAQPIAHPGEELTFSVDLLRPAAGWLAASAPAEDGRYIVYLKDASAPEGPGQPVAQFSIGGGAIVGATPVPLPLNVVP
jgi:hypothetical protein